MAILEYAVGIPHELALLCVNPCRVFAFFFFTGQSVYSIINNLITFMFSRLEWMGLSRGMIVCCCEWPKLSRVQTCYKNSSPMFPNLKMLYIRYLILYTNPCMPKVAIFLQYRFSVPYVFIITVIIFIWLFIVSIRASLTGWLILHHQTKLVTPSAFVRLAALLVLLFALPHLG